MQSTKLLLSSLLLLGLVASGTGACNGSDQVLGTLPTGGASAGSGASSSSSSSSSSGTATGGSSSSAGSTSSSSSSSASSTSSSGTCTLPSAAGLAYSAGLVVERTTNGGGTQWLIDAYVSTAPATSPCAGTQMGACCYAQPPTSLPPMQSAGTLTVTDGATTIAVMPPSNYSWIGNPAWAPGDTLTISASGATVDAFTVSAVAPALLTGLIPAFGVTPVTVQKSADLVISWTPSSQACSQVSVNLIQDPGNPVAPQIFCVADDAPGTLTVPAALLSMFTYATGGTYIARVEPASIDVANANVTMQIVDNYNGSVTYTP